MIVVGLTGSIGMGKSTASGVFRARGVPIFDADAVVHALYAGPLTGPVEAAFPGVVVDGRIDRSRLSAALADRDDAYAKLDAIVHPAVRAAADAFLAEQRAAGAPLALIDIPLLFEAGFADLADVTVVVSAPAEVQRARVLARPGMSETKFAGLMRQQMPDARKRALADVVIDTSVSRADSAAAIDRLIDRLLQGKSAADD